MTDTITPEAPKPTKTDILMQRQHNPDQATIDRAVGATTPGTVAEKIKESDAKAKEANEKRRKEPPNLKEDLTTVNEIPRFSETQLTELQTALNGSTPDARINSAIDGLKDIVKYIEAARKAEAKGTGSVVDEFSATEWSRIKKAVVGNLLQKGGLLDKFPDLAEIADEGARTDFVEALLARDPRFHRELAQSLHTLLNRTKAELVPDPQADELKLAEEERDTATLIQGEQEKNIKDWLENQGVPSDKVDAILQIIGTGDAGFAISRAVDELFAAKGIRNPQYLRSYQKAEQDIAAGQSQKSGLEADLAAEEKKATGKRDEGRISRLREQIGRIDSQIRGATTTRDNLRSGYKTTYSTTDADFDRNLQDYLPISEILNDSENIVNRAIQHATANKQRVKELGRRYTSLASNPEVKNRTDKQKETREELILGVENAIANSTARFLGKKYEDYVADQEIRSKAEAKEAEANGDKWKAATLKSLDQITSGWRRYNESTRKWEVNSNNIETSSHEFAAEAAKGNLGERRIIAKAAGYELDEEARRNTASEQITKIAGKKYPDLTPEEKIKVDQLLAQEKSRFDALVTEKGAAVREALMLAYAMKKNKVRLSADELVLIQGQMGNLLEKKLEESTQGRSVLAELRSKGIKPRLDVGGPFWAMIAFAFLSAGVLTTAIRR